MSEKKRLLSLPDVLRRAKPISYPLRGIYFLIDGDDIQYIGRTPNIYRRLGEHLGKKPRERFFFLPITEKDANDAELALLERRYIDKFKPSANVQKGFHENVERRAGGHPTSAVKRALELVEQGAATPYAAAKAEGIALSTIYRALRRKREG